MKIFTAEVVIKTVMKKRRKGIETCRKKTEIIIVIISKDKRLRLKWFETAVHDIRRARSWTRSCVWHANAAVRSREKPIS